MYAVPQSLHTCTVQYFYKDCMCFVSLHAETLTEYQTRYNWEKVSLWLLSACCGVWYSVIMADFLMPEIHVQQFISDYQQLLLLKVVAEL